MMTIPATLRLSLLLSPLLLAACGSDNAGPADAVQPPSTESAPQPESGYTAAPSPLITPTAPDRPARGPAQDLPPIDTRIPADAPNRINVTIRDPLPVSTAILIDAQGNQLIATRIDHDRLAYGGRGAGWPRIGVGVMGGSNSGVSTGVGIGFPLLPQTTEAAGSIYESHFSFLLPDQAAYASSWQRWKIHVDLSDGVNRRSFETLPPAPPAH